jgi:tight adherence protein C
MNITNILVLVGVFGGVVSVFVAMGVLVQKRAAAQSGGRWQTGVRKKELAIVEMTVGARHRPRKRSEPLTLKMVRPLAALWKLGDTSQSRLQELLVHAGIREKGAVEVFLGAKLALALALPAAVAATLMWRSSSTGMAINYRNMFMYAVMGLIVGLVAPIMWLRRKARQRIDKVRLSLPDALDLLIVCVESGLGLDAALLRISREMSDAAPELCEEITLMNLEISAGKPRHECLRNLGLRSGCDEVEALAARISQAAKFGTNLGNSLRIHSESLRQKRRQEAEERAAKTTVKLLFPLVFCIFPAIFVVILGPAALNIMKYFTSK